MTTTTTRKTASASLSGRAFHVALAILSAVVLADVAFAVQAVLR